MQYFTIALYQKFCSECEYQPLSESSLWRILREIKPSKRKCLGKVSVSFIFSVGIFAKSIQLSSRSLRNYSFFKKDEIVLKK